jgi:hypothetical protein
MLAGCSEMLAMQYRVENAVAPDASQAPADGLMLQPLAPVRRDIFTRSYRIGEPYTVRVGEPVVSIKNYSVTEKVGRATALRDFGQMCRRRMFRPKDASPCETTPLASVRGTMGSVFDVVAAVTLPEGKYFAVQLPPDGRAQVYLLVDPTGRLRKDEYIAWREGVSVNLALGRMPLELMAPDHALDSSAPLFSFESVEKFVYMGPGYLSFDLVFTGTRDTVRGDMMTFDYREYGRDSTERPAFERPLAFPAGQHVIELHELRIEVQPVGYDELRFRVIADAQPAPTVAPR